MLLACNFLEEKLCLRSLRLWGKIFIFDPLFSLGQKLKIQKVNFFEVFWFLLMNILGFAFGHSCHDKETSLVLTPKKIQNFRTKNFNQILSKFKILI